MINDHKLLAILTQRLKDAGVEMNYNIGYEHIDFFIPSEKAQEGYQILSDWYLEHSKIPAPRTIAIDTQLSIGYKIGENLNDYLRSKE